MCILEKFFLKNLWKNLAKLHESTNLVLGKKAAKKVWHFTKVCIVDT